MVAGANQPTSQESSYAHPLDALVNDPTGRAPLCDEARFAEILEGMVADNAPRLFAVVQEYGVRGGRADRRLGHGLPRPQHDRQHRR